MPSSTGTSYYRTRKVSAKKTLQSPSKLSVISGITTASKGSDESNSTVTQESHSRASRSVSKRRDSKQDLGKAKGPKNTLQEPDTPETGETRGPDVFAYLEDDEESENIVEGKLMEEYDTGHAPQAHPSEKFICTPESSIAGDDSAQDDSQATWRDEHLPSFTIHSDSGISVRSSSPELDSPIMGYKKLGAGGAATHQPNSVPEHTDRSQGSSAHMSHMNKSLPSLYEDIEANPEGFYRPSQPENPDQRHLHRPQRRPTNSTQPSQQSARALPTGPRRPKATKRIGYDLLSSNISTHSEGTLKPIYRKFETLNNRILLYLQDELSELEDELRVADAAIAREAKQVGRRQASRRVEAKMPSQLQWQRLELLGRIFAKTEQYSRALSSYNTLANTFAPAIPTDVQCYRGWVAEHMPVVEQETSFLLHDADMVTVKHEHAAALSPKSSSEAPLAAVALTFVSIIVIFRVVPRFLARLVIGMVIGFVMLTVLSPSHLRDIWNIRSWRRNTSIYAISIFILALLVG